MLSPFHGVPVGAHGPFAHNNALVGVKFRSEISASTTEEEQTTALIPPESAKILQATATQLDEYFRGKRTQFSLPLDLKGTDFRKKAWNELLKIPYGATISYSEQAKRLGGTSFCRAVGQANHHNPIAIIVPCHRVIGKTGKLTGYAGGLPIKTWLLDFEANYITPR